MSATNVNVPADGVSRIVPREQMTQGARRLCDFYERKPGAPFYSCEFANGYFFTMERWKAEGMPQDVPMAELFGFDEPSWVQLWGAGWGSLPIDPVFEEKLIEDRSAHEVIRDGLGRHVLYFKGCRDGYMPEYIDHPVNDEKSWEEQLRWRLNPNSPLIWKDLDATIAKARADVAKGFVVMQRSVGGYMWLRSLVGPTELLYMVHDNPALIHKMMETWTSLVDTIIARHQEFLSLDEIFFGEDICYNHGPLISPDMIREFLLPYYQQVLDNARRRQIDKERHLYFQIDSDGLATPVIKLYQSVGMDVMSPFEVASGCDVVEIGKQFPTLAMNGGIDKRVLGSNKDAIDRLVERILPAMRQRGGYYPTCDHGVPATVCYENYLHYRKRCVELGS